MRVDCQLKNVPLAVLVACARASPLSPINIRKWLGYAKAFDGTLPPKKES